jgi:hypothetical protein
MVAVTPMVINEIALRVPMSMYMLSIFLGAGGVDEDLF